MRGKMRLRNKIFVYPPPSRNGKGMKLMMEMNKKGRNLLYIDLLIIMNVLITGCE